MWYCYRNGDPFWGQRVGCRLTLGNELSNKMHIPTKQTLLGRGPRAERSRVREPRTAPQCGLWSQVLWSRGEFPGCLLPVIWLGPYLFWLRALPGGVCIAQQGRFQQEGLWEAACLFPLSPTQPRPHQIRLVSFQGQHGVLYRDLLLWDNSGRCTWPRQVVLVNSSLKCASVSCSVVSDSLWPYEL